MFDKILVERNSRDHFFIPIWIPDIMKVLAIDDNEDITTLLEMVFTGKGHEFAKSNNGREGLEMILAQKYDIILLDMAMPQYTGTEVINELKKAGKLKDQKIIIFTASSATESELNMILENEGVCRCVKKPVKTKQLLEIVEEVVQQ